MRGQYKPKQKRLPAEAGNLLSYNKFFGVADGARTHDNRNHNPRPRPPQAIDFYATLKILLEYAGENRRGKRTFFRRIFRKKKSLGGPCRLHFATVVDLLNHPLAVVPGCIGDELVTLIDAVSHGSWSHIR